MLARNMVIREGSQPITLQPSKTYDGFRIINGSIHILYEIVLNREGCSFYDWDENKPFLASVLADDFLVNEPYQNAADRPFVSWMAGRAREIIDREVASVPWHLTLADAGTKGYFRVGIKANGAPQVHPHLLNDSNFLWTCFIPRNSDDYRTIEAQYAAEAA